MKNMNTKEKPQKHQRKPMNKNNDTKIQQMNNYLKQKVKRKNQEKTMKTTKKQINSQRKVNKKAMKNNENQ